VGGNAKPTDSEGIAEGEIIRIDTSSWECARIKTQGPSPGNRDSHTTTVVGPKGRKQLLVFGGTDGDIKFNEIHVLDLRTKLWTVGRPDNSPPEREGHTATLMGNLIVVFGGNGSLNPEDQERSPAKLTNHLNDVHFFDTDTWEWKEIKVQGEPPWPRDSHAAAPLGDKLVIYGGDCYDNYLSDVHVLDMGRACWVKQKCVSEGSPGARAGHIMAPFGDGILLYGGVMIDGKNCCDCWLLRVGPNEELGLSDGEAHWEPLPVAGDLPCGRFAHGADSSKDALFVFGGLCDEQPMDDLHVLQFPREPPPEGRPQMSGSLPPASPVQSEEGHGNNKSPTAVNSCPGEEDEQGGDSSDAVTSSLDSPNREESRIRPAEDAHKDSEAGVDAQAEMPRTGSSPAQLSGPAPNAAPPPSSGVCIPRASHPREGKVTSYNMYCNAIREKMRRDMPEIRPREIERRIGQQWAHMSIAEKRPFEEAARMHNALAKRQATSSPHAGASGGAPKHERPPDQEPARYERPSDRHEEMLAKRAKFRGSMNAQDQQSFNSKLNPKPWSDFVPPRASDADARRFLRDVAGTGMAPPGAIPGAGIAPFFGGLRSSPYLMPNQPEGPPSHGHPYASAVDPGKQNAGSSHGGPTSVPHSPQPQMLGATVEGTVDGMFNAGYLATVRVGGNTFRAVLFSPILNVAASDGAAQISGLAQPQGAPGPNMFSAGFPGAGFYAGMRSHSREKQ